MKVCKIHECNKPVVGRGFCSRHYVRWMKYGDPTAFFKLTGEQKHTVIHNAESGCQEWTGPKDKDGYARVCVNGKYCRLSRRVLARKLGRPINEGMMALHTCDNPGCVAPDHLYEGDSSDNMKDRSARGRFPESSKTTMAKISREEASKIKHMIMLGVRTKEIAGKYRISRSQVYRIKWGECWGNVL